MTHAVKVKRYDVSPGRIVIGANGSYGSDLLEFLLSEDWDGLDVFVTMYPIGRKPITVDYSGKPIQLPNALYDCGKTDIVISGFGEKRCMNSEPILITPQNTIRKIRR